MANLRNTVVTGSLQVSSSAAGESVFNVTGSTGTLFTVVDSVQGDIFTVMSGSTSLLSVNSGSINAYVPINGTASLALSSISSSYALTSNSASYALTASYALSSPGGGGGLTLSYFNPQDAYLQVAGQIGQNSLQFQPVQAPNVVFDRIMFPVNYSNATNSSNSVTLSMYIGIYTRNNSTLSLYSSFSTSYNITNSGTVGSYTLYSGMRLLSINVNAGNTLSLSEGQYYVGIMSRTTTGGGAGMSISNMLASQISSTFAGLFGAASNASIQYTRGLGVYSATTTAFPSGVPFSDIRGSNPAVLKQPLFYFVYNTY